jgi:hypothetical protein
MIVRNHYCAGSENAANLFRPRVNICDSGSLRNCWNRVFSIYGGYELQSRREWQRASFSRWFPTTLLNLRSMLAVFLGQ